ncbi:unnamed protein product [Linum trigynum]|uniref:Uncharacterized protein n=1 Tax=Linum trigynum TaxID=586398 RepID=A0AAV2FCJ6_9ROSI
MANPQASLSDFPSSTILVASFTISDMVANSLRRLINSTTIQQSKPHEEEPPRNLCQNPNPDPENEKREEGKDGIDELDLNKDTSARLVAPTQALLVAAPVLPPSLGGSQPPPMPARDLKLNEGGNQMRCKMECFREEEVEGERRTKPSS